MPRPKKKNQETRRQKHLRLSYGWTESIYEHVLLMQGMSCAICGSEDPKHWSGKFSVDHNHETGEPRGCLCFKCNSAIGNFNEDINSIKNAITYLNEHAGTDWSSKPASSAVA